MSIGDRIRPNIWLAMLLLTGIVVAVLLLGESDELKKQLFNGAIPIFAILVTKLMEPDPMEQLKNAVTENRSSEDTPPIVINNHYHGIKKEEKDEEG